MKYADRISWICHPKLPNCFSLIDIFTKLTTVMYTAKSVLEIL